MYAASLDSGVMWPAWEPMAPVPRYSPWEAAAAAGGDCGVRGGDTTHGTRNDRLMTGYTHVGTYYQPADGHLRTFNAPRTAAQSSTAEEGELPLPAPPGGSAAEAVHRVLVAQALMHTWPQPQGGRRGP